MNRSTGTVLGLMLVMAVLAAAPAIAACAGAMELEHALGNKEVIGVTQREVFASRPGLKIWAEGSVSAATLSWGVPKAADVLESHGGRFNVLSQADDDCEGSARSLGSEIYELTWAEGSRISNTETTVRTAADFAGLDARFGSPQTYDIGTGDRVAANMTLWIGPTLTLAVSLAIALGTWRILRRRRSRRAAGTIG